MISKLERFWIAFILRFAIGFLFLFAALNQFSTGPKEFADALSKGFASTWMADIPFPGGFTGEKLAWYFLFALPYIFAGLSALILTGILVRPALRLGALVLIILGLGKYLQGDVVATANDYLFALIICIGLFFYSLEKRRPVPDAGSAAA